MPVLNQRKTLERQIRHLLSIYGPGHLVRALAEQAMEQSNVYGYEERHEDAAKWTKLAKDLLSVEIPNFLGT